MSFRGLRVLVAEDNLLEAEMVEHALGREGCEVVGPVAHLAQAVELAMKGELDGALLDVNLAGVNCFAAAWRLQERRIPFAFMSAYPRSYIPGPGPLRGVHFIAKPLNLTELLHTVAGFVRPDAPRPAKQKTERRLKRRQLNI